MIDTIKNGCQHIKKTAVKERKVSMKKRMLAAILSGIMVIMGISACSGNAATSSENSSASTTTTTTKAETTAATTTTTTTATQKPEPAPAETKGDSVQFSQNLMPGWNLGNQLESNSDGTPSETAWGNPVITENLIKQVKAQGFKSIRIPVSYLSEDRRRSRLHYRLKVARQSAGSSRYVH